MFLGALSSKFPMNDDDKRVQTVVSSEYKKAKFNKCCKKIMSEINRSAYVEILKKKKQFGDHLICSDFTFIPLTVWQPRMFTYTLHRHSITVLLSAVKSVTTPWLQRVMCGEFLSTFKTTIKWTIFC